MHKHSSRAREAERYVPDSARNNPRQSSVSRESFPVISPRNASSRSSDISSGGLQTYQASILENQQIPETEQHVPVEPVVIALYFSQHRIDETPQFSDAVEEDSTKGGGFSPRP